MNIDNKLVKAIVDGLQDKKGKDIVVGTVLTDSAVMYQSRITELNEMHGAYNAHEAALDHNLQHRF